MNSHYTIIFDNPRDRTQVRYLAREMFPDCPKVLQEAYADASKNSHGYLFIDNKQGTPEELRIQTKIENTCRVVYKPKKFI